MHVGSRVRRGIDLKSAATAPHLYRPFSKATPNFVNQHLKVLCFLFANVDDRVLLFSDMQLLRLHVVDTSLPATNCIPPANLPNMTYLHSFSDILQSERGLIFAKSASRVRNLTRCPPSDRLSTGGVQMTFRSAPTIFVIDDDAEVRASIQNLLKAAGLHSESYGTAEEFLA